MISADKNDVIITGDVVEIAEQFGEVAKAIRTMLTNASGNAEFADKALDAFYELSKLSDEDLEGKSEEEIMGIVLGDLYREEEK